MFPAKQRVMKKFPTVLNYIAGKKEGKLVIKIFLEKQEYKADIKTFFEETCGILKDEDFDFQCSKKFVLDVDNPKQTPPIDRIAKNRLQEVIQDEEDKLVALHSSLVGIGVGRVKINETKFGEECIVLYCLDKTLLPFGEKKFPEFLKGEKVDIREDCFMFASCEDCNQLEKGCCIGIAGEGLAGSVGFLVKSKNPSSNECGFLTAAHVVYKNIFELSESAAPVLGNFHKIVHPAESDNVVGSFTKAFCGNHKSNGYQKGIDAAFVRFEEKEKRGIFSSLGTVNH